MPRTAVVPINVTLAGGILSAAFVTPDAAGSSFVNYPNETFLIVKAGATGTNVTLQTPGKLKGVAISPPVIAISANQEVLLGPFPAEVFAQSDGTVWVDYSAITTITVAVARMSRL